MVILTAIPTRDRFDLLAPLLTNLLASEINPILVMDNGYSYENRKSLNAWAEDEPRLMIADCQGQTIYQMWNFAMDFAIECEADYLCLLNDDVSMPVGGVQKLGETLELLPDVWALSPRYRDEEHGWIQYVSGTYSSHGLAGFAFIFDPRLPVRFDEEFGYWYGDDDFVKQIEAKGGRVAILNDVKIDHVGGATSVAYPELGEVIERDRKRFVAKW